MHLLVKRVISLLLLLALPFHNLLLDLEAVDVSIVALLGQSEENKDLIVMLADSASYTSVKLVANKLVNPHKLALFYPVEADVAVVEVSGEDDDGVLVDFLDNRLDRGRRDAGVVYSFEVGIVLIKAHEEEHVFLAVTIVASED